MSEPLRNPDIGRSSPESSFQEIGGNFWFDPDQPLEGAFNNRLPPFLEGERDRLYTSSGRGAITQILRELVPASRIALLPSYTCESVITPFVRLGYQVHFYNILSDLSPDVKSLDQLIDQYYPEVIFTQSYYGFDTIKNLRNRYGELRDRGITIIEDITHSLFSRLEKPEADFYLASLRKWLAVPDGGVAISFRNRFNEASIGPHTELVAQNLEAIRLKHRYVKTLDSSLKDEFRKLFYASEDLLDHDRNVYVMSDVTSELLKYTDVAAIVRKRRRNFTHLLESVNKSPWLTPIFNHLPEAVVPLYLPVYVRGERNALQNFFACDEIYMPILWPIPSIAEPYLSSSSSKIYSQILCIPCDQRYSLRDMERIVERLSNYKV